MENATRSGHTSAKGLLNSLTSCIEKDALIPPQEKEVWRTAKEKGKALFNTIRRGSYQVFKNQPLMDDMRKYCVGDVQFLPHLRNLYLGDLIRDGKERWSGRKVGPPNHRLDVDGDKGRRRG
jgi:exonuclease 3'-5' domain-containing protein 1